MTSKLKQLFVKVCCFEDNIVRCFTIFISREAIAEAIIGLLLVFYNSKNLNCIGALSFLRFEEEYWRSPFFNQFYWSDF